MCCIAEKTLKKLVNDKGYPSEILKLEFDFKRVIQGLVIDKSKGNDVVLLGAIFQSSPLMLMALEESDIKSIKDIKDKTIMIVKDQENFATFQTMLKSQGLELSHLNFIQHTFNVDDLINKKILKSTQISQSSFSHFVLSSDKKSIFVADESGIISELNTSNLEKIDLNFSLDILYPPQIITYIFY